MHIAIVEDDPATRAQLAEYIQRYTRQYGTTFQVDTFADGDEIAENYRPVYDILFMDIEMKHLDGMETARRIRQLDGEVLIIFITNTAQYAINGYSVGATDYMLKPVPYFCFSQQLKKAVGQLQKRARFDLTVTAEDGMRRLNTAEIYYIESDGHTVHFYTENGDFSASGLLKNFEEKLAGRPFALTIIEADTEVLEMDFDENEWLQDIREQTKRLADLTGSLVMLSRMEEGQNGNLKVEFPLSDMVEEVCHTFQAPAKIQGICMKTAITPMISIKGDEKAIRSLITILLDNAVKYTNERGRIDVTLGKKKNRIYLSVFNTTEYISKEQTSRLFDRFYRTDISRNSQTGGYGLGLSIAAATADSHKGKIMAETEDEKSLRITVTFPGQ